MRLKQWKIIARQISESDYYVAIIAHRYGSVNNEISYTRKEYEFALSVGTPVLGFVIEPTAPWPQHLVDNGETKEFLGRLQKPGHAEAHKLLVHCHGTPLQMLRRSNESFCIHSTARLGTRLGGRSSRGHIGVISA